MVAAALSCVSMLISPVAMAATPMAAPVDVALHEGGVLVGQVVDAQGRAVAQASVSLQSRGQEIARAQTDQTGRFRVEKLRGGVYQVASANHQGVYRFWAPKTAPPSAQPGLMMVSASDVVRGQGTGGPFTSAAQWIADHPIITAGAIAAAIAIPLAIDNNDPPSSP